MKKDSFFYATHVLVMSRIPAQMYLFNTKNNNNKIIQAAIKA